MKICKNCKSNQNDEAIFCSECGCMEFENNSISESDKIEQEINENKDKSSDNSIDNFIDESLQEEVKQVKVSSSVILNLLDDNENIIKTWKLSKLPSYTLGRISSKGSVDIDFSDIEGGEYVSRTHAKIYKDNNKWYFVDLNSKYGSEHITTEFRQSLVAKQEVELSNSDMLILAKKIKLEIVIKTNQKD